MLYHKRDPVDRRRFIAAGFSFPAWGLTGTGNLTLEQRVDSLERAFNVWANTATGRAHDPQEYIARLRRRCADLEKRVAKLEGDGQRKPD